MDKIHCKVTKCDATTIHLRGLCRNCYNYAASLVLHRIVTWDQLEAAGCVGPAGYQTQSPKRPERTEWFARGAGMSPETMSDTLRERVREYGVQLRRFKRRVK
jgi:hypothetical protein